MSNSYLFTWDYQPILSEELMKRKHYRSKNLLKLFNGRLKLLNEKLKGKAIESYAYVTGSEHIKAVGAIALISMLLIPEIGLAAETKGVDAFQDAFDKITGWITGSAGKLITIISIVIAGAIGIAGFPWKYVLGSFGVGMLLASSVTIVNMLFA
jgi:type IV secretory pathway VirB2 component (pilin)